MLLIEDDSDARLLAAKAVERLGARVVTADSGLSGLAVAKALIPDLIVLDLGLPDIHGREVVRRLSHDPQLQHIPVVIYSADTDSVEGLSTASVLEKPATLEDIADAIAAHLGPRRQVLVVDDDPDTREVLCSLLHSLGVDTLEAGDGREALAVVREHDVDLVLLDICVPRLTGFEFLEQIRGDAELGGTAVVICTAFDLEPSEARAVAGDAKAIIRKGFNLEGRIEEIVHNLLRKAGS